MLEGDKSSDLSVFTSTQGGAYDELNIDISSIQALREVHKSVKGLYHDE